MDGGLKGRNNKAQGNALIFIHFSVFYGGQ
jgi:hypothetical protein